VLGKQFLHASAVNSSRNRQPGEESERSNELTVAARRQEHPEFASTLADRVDAGFVFLNGCRGRKRPGLQKALEPLLQQLLREVADAAPKVVVRVPLTEQLQQRTSRLRCGCLLSRLVHRS
jgi:hypothetical protein